MFDNAQNDNSRPTIQALYPQLNEQQAIEAEENLRRYLQLAFQIYERLQEDAELYAQFKHLTASKAHPTMHGTKAGPSNDSYHSSQK